MLIDDNKLDNFFHTRVIRKHFDEIEILTYENAESALECLSDLITDKPQIIFLDINMPGMDGWEFLENYKKLDISQRECMVVIMLTTSEDPDDISKATANGILTDFKTKPLTREMLIEVVDNFINKNG